MKKRALCLFLALALCLSLLPASAFAANGSKAIMLGSDILSEGGGKHERRRHSIFRQGRRG